MREGQAESVGTQAQGEREGEGRGGEKSGDTVVSLWFQCSH